MKNPGLIWTQGNLSLNSSTTSLLNGAAPELTLLNDDKSHAALLACFTSPRITGGTAVVIPEQNNPRPKKASP
ncbi:OPC-8:0 CoA ligase1 [Prunus dulcis]|uniref:OPC-8:0 CoA ligase1 n=1 Tax=Prunus dulcis TaxID=3755 RepID=A0A4Y1QYT7_PRUDU|nr:OPC-8:0 CoA ligase1 [Prunus dulcis]